MSKISPPSSTQNSPHFPKVSGSGSKLPLHQNPSTLSTLTSYADSKTLWSYLRVPLVWLRSLYSGLAQWIFGPPSLTLPPLPKKSNYLSRDLSDRSVLANIFKETKTALDQGFYTLLNKTKISLDLDPMKNNTKVWTHEALKEKVSLEGRQTYDTAFEVLNIDTVLAGLKLLSEGLNPLLLNMANRYTEGGGVLSGCLAQEELCRKTGLYVSISLSDNPHLASQMGAKYLIPEFGCIYSPAVPIVRERKEDHFEWIEKPQQLNFVSSAAYDTRHHGGDILPKGAAFEEGMRAKIKSQILCALAHGHDSLVLGAYGCGAFGQDPEKVSKWYSEELAPYQKYFRKITFAVLVARPSDQPNFENFYKTFIK